MRSCKRRGLSSKNSAPAYRPVLPGTDRAMRRPKANSGMKSSAIHDLLILGLLRTSTSG